MVICFLGKYLFLDLLFLALRFFNFVIRLLLVISFIALVHNQWLIYLYVVTYVLIFLEIIGLRWHAFIRHYRHFTRILNEKILIVLYNRVAGMHHIRLYDSLLDSHGMSLIRFALDILQFLLFVTMELGMLEDLVLVILSFWFMEIVHVKLANKGRKVIVFEILRKNLLWKFSLIFDHESFAVRGPWNNVF